MEVSSEKIKFSIKTSQNKMALKQGLKAGIPIGLGYFAVAFSLGIMAKKAGLSIFASTVVSLFCNASAGEYAGFATIAAAGTFLEMVVVTFIVNARYLLMSSAMSQRVKPGTHIVHRMIMGLYVTDEIFGVSMSRPGYLNPWFNYGCAIVASPCWALGTALGCFAGNVLPLRVVSALSVALFGMFLAIIIPPAKKDKIIAVLVLVSFALSSAMTYLPVVKNISEGLRTIILTVVIAAAAALLFPRKEED